MEREEAIKIVKSHYPANKQMLNEALEFLIPELKESENERIRKALVRFHKSTIDVDGIKGEEIVAWLEKQGEQKVPINDFKAKNWYVSEVDGKIHDMTYNPADKVEPKFHEGDWIINDQGSAFQIAYIDTENCRYVFEIGGYTKEEMNYETIAFANNHYRKWTIDDAKDGDVLIDKSHVGECVFIFKEARPSDIKTDVNNPLAIIGYCGINHIGFTSQLSGLGFGDTVNCTYYPATKEQRELLFKKMKESGYEWNPDTKKLKKVEQKPTWSEEDERMVEEILDAIEEVEYEMALNMSDVRQWLKNLKQRLS